MISSHPVVNYLKTGVHFDIDEKLPKHTANIWHKYFEISIKAKHTRSELVNVIMRVAFAILGAAPAIIISVGTLLADFLYNDNIYIRDLDLTYLK